MFQSPAQGSQIVCIDYSGGVDQPASQTFRIVAGELSLTLCCHCALLPLPGLTNGCHPRPIYVLRLSHDMRTHRSVFQEFGTPLKLAQLCSTTRCVSCICLYNFFNQLTYIPTVGTSRTHAGHSRFPRSRCESQKRRDFIRMWELTGRKHIAWVI